MERISGGRAWARALVLPLCLAAIVLGILGMHAFAQHGATHSADSMWASMSAPVSHEAASDHSALVSSDSGDGHSSGEMVMMCAAMLLGAALGALLALRLWRVARSRTVRAAVSRTSWTPRTIRAGTSPPYVWEFSVVRC